MVDIADTRKIALHEFAPLIVFFHPLVPVSSSMVMGVQKVIWLYIGNLNGIDWIKVEPAFRNLPGDMWAEQSDSEK